MRKKVSRTRVPPAQLARAVEWTRHHVLRIHQRLVPPPMAMMEMIVAGWPAQAITAAAQLGIADALAEGPLSLDELAARVGADPDALRRLLRALVGRGVFRRRRDGRYALNSLAATLRFDAPISLRGAALFQGSKEQRERWTLLADSVRTGRSVVPALRGKASWDYIAEKPELAALFDQTITSITQLTAATVVAGYDFAAHRTIVDVGGGQGTMLAAILAAAPSSRGVLYDLHRVVANAPNALGDSAVAGRVRIAEGSFFDGVPSGGDAYVLKNVIHDWDDEKAVRILRNVRAAAGPRTAVLLVEMVVGEGGIDGPANWVDLEMLLNLGSRERTAEQYRKLLGQAGLRMTRVVPTASPLSVIEAHVDGMDIAAMPRGGFDAGWLDRKLQTERTEYLDRDDVGDRTKRRVIRSLDRMGRILRDHAHIAALALDLVSDIADPRILELGSGHGGLSRKLLQMHPTTRVTVTDIDPVCVADIAAGGLGAHPRAVVRRMDATDIDAPEGSYDLAVFALSFHHLPPVPAARVLAEGTRAADTLLIVDLRRPRAPLHLFFLAALFPFALVLPFAHDGLISSLRAYGPAGFGALAAHADPAITLQFGRIGRNQVVVARRRRPGPAESVGTP